MSGTDISIIIVNYNVKDFLLQCLRSIEQASKGLSIETIVIDNASSDGSVNFLEPLFPDVKFIALEENIGFGRANNLGIKESSGRYVLILNPDTILEEQTLSKMLKYMDEHTEVGISGCKVLNPDGTFQLACRRGFPTPWASFSKLFGLQKLFPKSKLFARYNQTFRSINETYYIDAVIGAFMFCRKEVLDQTKGFDPDFFMYAEDIDLCYRASKLGWKISYFHETSIIHFKGESTRRSSINDVKHFYDAMEIFAKKHYSGSGIFLLFLRIGILLRSAMAYMNKYKRDIFVILFDLLSVNGSLLIATKFRFDDFFNFPDYAYPTVFIVISLIMLTTLFIVGDYFENKPIVRRSTFGLLMGFFILSTLTYFFKEEWGFSRGVLVMMTGLAIFFSGLARIVLSIFDKTAGKDADIRIAIAGINRQSENIINSLRKNDILKTDIVGLISIHDEFSKPELNLPLLGNIEYLPRIIDQNKIHEVIITDPSLTKNEIIRIISKTSNPRVRFHLAHEYEELVAAKLANEISGIEPTVKRSNITKFRYRIVKRFLDVILSLFLLSIGRPLVYLFSNEPRSLIKKIWLVLKGKYSIIGLYPIEGEKTGPAGKIGLTGLAHISKPGQLSKVAIMNLNDYYLEHYTFSIDTDIFLKFIFRKNRGN